jgi:hypothetical protein
MFDTSNYDVACVLRHLALASRMYSDTDREGLAKGAYYLTLSRQICERIGAINDENYLITLKMLSLYERVDVEEKLAFAATQPRVRSPPPHQIIACDQPTQHDFSVDLYSGARTGWATIRSSSTTNTER